MPTDFRPSDNEDEYFAREDAELRRQLRMRADAERAKKEQEEKNRCPRCHVAMVPRQMDHVTIDQCPQCGGVWLDKGELDILSTGRREHAGFLGALLDRVR